MQRLALDHLTAVDCDPLDLVEAARSAGCDAICLFLEPMAALPLLPQFDLYTNPPARRALRERMAALGVALDLVYPFTLSQRTRIADFAVAMEVAAELGAGLLNVLSYDRDPVRRLDQFGAFCDLAAGFGHRVAIEFYPPSRIGSLAAALDLVEAIARPRSVGITVDVLHLMRSDGSPAALARVSDWILYAQLADGPATAPADRAHEASSERMLVGAGAFDVAGFVDALPPGCPVSVELPRDHLVVAGVPRAERVTAAVDSVRRALGTPT